MADVCTLGFAVGDMPYIVTLNFGFEWIGTLPLLYFHCAREGRKLDMMSRNPHVCFQLDSAHELVTGPNPCDWGMKYASLLGYGTLRRAGGDEERGKGLDRIMLHYGRAAGGGYAAAPMKATEVLVLDVDEMSGKRRA